MLETANRHFIVSSVKEDLVKFDAEEVINNSGKSIRKFISFEQYFNRKGIMKS